MGAGDNGWGAMHSAFSGGLGNNWANADGPWSLGYYKRQDIPTHFDIAEGWTVADMASQSILAATDPNRIFWMSGSVNIPGSPTNPDGKGGMIIDNSATPGGFSDRFRHADPIRTLMNVLCRLRGSRSQLLPLSVEVVSGIPRGGRDIVAGLARSGQL